MCVCVCVCVCVLEDLNLSVLSSLAKVIKLHEVVKKPATSKFEHGEK